MDTDQNSDQSSEDNGTESEVTSDEESLEQQKVRQLSLIRDIEKQMRTRIARDGETYASLNLHAGVLRMHEPRLKGLKRL